MENCLPPNQDSGVRITELPPVSRVVWSIGRIPDCLSGGTGSIPVATANLYWLAGILEGEGSFLKGPPSNPHMPAVVLQMCDEDVVHRVATIFGVAVHRCNPRKSHHRPSFITQIRGGSAVQLMKMLQPLMSGRRKHQIDEAVATYKILGRYCKWTKITRELLDEARARMAKGESLRSVARSFDVNHETLRRRLIA